MTPAATFDHLFGFENPNFLERQPFFFLMRNLAELFERSFLNLKKTLPLIEFNRPH